LDSGRCRTLAGSRYVLCEYSHDSEFSFVYQMTQELILHGYIPVIAHVERYACMTEDLDRADELRNLGAWIQMNADAVLGMEGLASKKYCKKMLKAGYVDVIASDSHGIRQRACHLDRCWELLQKKFGEAYAKALLRENPAKILAGVQS
jgi:protein-tyrosine phosphatase